MIPGSWSHAAAGTLIVLCIIGAAYITKPRKKNRRVRRHAQPAQVFDFYAEKRARMIEHLGDDYLLARPINRR